MASKRSSEVEMPDDWNDAEGWNSYYRSLSTRIDDEARCFETGSISIDRVPEFVAGMKEVGWRSAWLPGCGISPLGRMLAHLGLEVVATDVSPVAIEIQNEPADRISKLLNKLGEPDPAGSFSAEVHDFRERFRPNAFDVIINVKAFQAFPPADMLRISRVHAESLRPGRDAYFDTMNVQGERRDILEQALEDGGFVVPFAEANKWYRQRLRETGIPHFMILGSPMVPRTGEYAEDEDRRNADTQILREITMHYRSRLEADQEAEMQRGGPDARVAQIIYSTG